MKQIVIESPFLNSPYQSSPFDPTGTGKIAVNVISHYADEVLKVFDV